MQKILFVRKFKKPSGGQIKVRDYFRHCLHHPDLEPYLYFTPASEWPLIKTFWDCVPEDRIVSEVRFDRYDLLFLAGRDWEYLPEIASNLPVINLIQHVKHADKTDKRYQQLSKPAWRICASEQVAEAISPYAAGEVIVIKYGIPLELFTPDLPKRENSIFIWARKNPDLGARLFEILNRQKRQVSILFDYLTREDFALRLKQSDILVALPNRTEGFFLPALEGMASGCAVICSDAVGNRSFCRHEETCLMPAYDNYEEHLQMIEKLLANFDLKETLRRRGMQMAPAFSLETERKTFYDLLERIIIQS